MLSRAGAGILALDLVGSDWDALEREVVANGQRFLAIEDDVADEATWAALAVRVRAEFGRIDVLFNNAGIWGPSCPV